MVIILALYPLVLAAGVALMDRLAPAGLVAIVTTSPFLTATLGLLALGAVLVAAFRSRESPVLMSAWLFFFVGALIVALGYLLEPFIPEEASWVEEVFETVALLPLLIFVGYVASPLRLVMFSRAQRRLYVVLGSLLLLGTAAAVFLPWLFGQGGPRPHSSAENVLHLAQTVIDVLLMEPIAFVLLVIGLSGASRAYFLVGLGLLFLLPEDIVGSFRLLRLSDVLGQYSRLLFAASQLLVINGALLCAFEKRRTRDVGDPTY
jgi:hypothetical protein